MDRAREFAVQMVDGSTVDLFCRRRGAAVETEIGVAGEGRASVVHEFDGKACEPACKKDPVLG